MQHRGTSTRKCLSLPIRAHFIERDMFSFSGLEDSVILQIFFPGPAECGGAQAPWSWEVEQLAHGRHRWESDNLPTKTVSAEYTLDFIAGLVAGLILNFMFCEIYQNRSLCMEHSSKSFLRRF